MKFRIKTKEFKDGKKTYVIEKKWLRLFWKAIPLKRLVRGDLMVVGPASFLSLTLAEDILKKYGEISKKRRYRGYRIYPFISSRTKTVRIYCPNLIYYRTFENFSELDKEIDSISIFKINHKEYTI
jgi:hypothetical protein